MATPAPHRLNVEEVGDVTCVRFVDGKIYDEASVQAVGAELFALVDERGRRNLQLDFSNIEYLAGPVLGKLVALNQKLRKLGGRLILVHISPDISDVFKITKLDQFFDLHAEGDGVASPPKPPG